LEHVRALDNEIGEIRVFGEEDLAEEMTSSSAYLAGVLEAELIGAGVSVGVEGDHGENVVSPVPRSSPDDERIASIALIHGSSVRSLVICGE
jgi:predicted nucleic acid-binding protein